MTERRVVPRRLDLSSITAARGALWGVSAIIWLALARLAVAFLTNELSWSYVAGQSRRDAPWYYRLAGVWGGSEGSLLLFTGVVAAIVSIEARRCRRPSIVWAATITVVTLTCIDLAFASPFGRLDAPALRGFGLTPILEHPAMAIHPPLLYVGLAGTAAAALAVLDGRSPRAWLRTTVGLVTLAMALGGLWSYVEQGWGGYWAWDPVENTSLIVWMAALIALHGAWSGRRAMAAGAAPWVLALVGATLVRSGSTPSIHGFARQASVGWAMLALAAVTAIVIALAIARSTRQPAPLERANPGLANTVLAGIALVVVFAGTVAPVLIDVVGDRPSAVRGVFFSRLVGPLALVAVPFIAMRLRHPRGRLAHVGILVLFVGIAASTFDRSATIGIHEGEAVTAAGMSIRGGPITVADGPRAGTQAVVAEVELDGHTLHPSLVAYPERGGVLAETAIVTRPWGDLQVTLNNATDSGLASITVRSRPLVWLVWLGALLTAAGALPSEQLAHRRTRRRRLRS